MTPRAASAFRDFVDLRFVDRDATLEDLANQYKSCTKAVPTRQLSRLKIWSAKYGWMGRIASAITDAAEQKLQEAAEIDADTFLRTSGEMHRRSKHADALSMDALVRLRESVRKPTPKGGASVNVRVSVEVRRLAEQMAERLGVSAEELIADAERVAAGAWGDH